MRQAKELLIASKDFASERRWLSWWHVWSTLGALCALIAITVTDLPMAVRGVASVVAGLVAVRLFIIYHDYQHRAILGDSKFGAWLMALSGLVMLNPPRVWNRTHDYHHKNNSKIFGSSVGSFPIMTTASYATASRSERFGYAAARHPLTMIFGYMTVFFWRMSLRPFLLSPRKHFDGGVAVLLHLALAACLIVRGVDDLFLALIVPFLVSASLGAYLFYAQHNFPSARIMPSSEWSHVDAALYSSSFMTMGPVMNWFTGNIGYHHVHHLNARIPFYRLPEAMRALEELQSPGTTSLKVRDIAACLRLKLWCPEQERFVGFNGG